MTVGLDSAGSQTAADSVFAPQRHGDSDAAAGLIDFAVNVRGAMPAFVRAELTTALDDLAAYPTAVDDQRAVSAAAAAHGRDPAEIMLLGGAAEGFELLPKLGVGHAALIQPSFTEPEIALRAAGIRITQVVLPPPWQLDPDTVDDLVPADADLVVLGNPTNPTSVLHPAAAIEALRRPGRIVVVDEAFADLTRDPTTGALEPESVAGLQLPDVIVLRSITKTFGLAGLRAGYAIGDPAVLARLRVGRRPWALGTPAVRALAVCVGEQGQRYCAEQARAVESDRAAMVEALAQAGIEPAVTPQAPFVLVEIPHGLRVREMLRDKGFSVRSAANFVGLSPDHLRLAVRSPAVTAGLIEALVEVKAEVEAGVSARPRKEAGDE